MAVVGKTLIDKLLGISEAEDAFRPWWKTMETYTVYGVILLGKTYRQINRKFEALLEYKNNAYLINNYEKGNTSLCGIKNRCKCRVSTSHTNYLRGQMNLVL